MQPNTNNNMDFKTEHDPDFKDDQHTNPIIFVQHRPLHPQPTTTTTTTTTHQPRPVQTYPQHQPPVRCCEFCGSSNTPTWRRGPAGKASLCNACGIKWRLRKRMKKGDQSPSDRAKPLYSPKKKKQQEDPNPAARRTIYKEPRIMGINLSDHAHPHIIERGRRKHYYCKYCKQTWAISHFKNSQQFGAHCSNCSRRPAGSSSPLSDNETMMMGDFQPTYIGAEMPYYHHSPQFDDEDEDEHYVPSYSSSYGSSYGSSFGSSGYVSPSPPASPSLPRSSAGGRSTYGGALAMAASPPSPDVVMVPSSPDADLLLNLLNVSHQMEDEDHQDVHLPLTTVRKVTANPYAQSSSSQHHAVSNPIPIPMVKIPNSLQQLATVATEDVRVNNSYFHFHNAAAASSFSSSRFSRVPRFD